MIVSILSVVSQFSQYHMKKAAAGKFILTRPVAINCIYLSPRSVPNYLNAIRVSDRRRYVPIKCRVCNIFRPMVARFRQSSQLVAISNRPRESIKHSCHLIKLPSHTCITLAYKDGFENVHSYSIQSTIWAM